MKKKLSRFYIVYFSLLILFSASLIIFLAWLNGAVSRYNESLPETVSERFYSDTFKTKDIGKISEYVTDLTNDFETDADLVEKISEIFAEEMSYTSVSSGDDGVEKYIVKSGAVKTAEFSLEKDSDGNWAVKNVKIYLPDKYEYKVKILSSSRLYINGIEVGEEYASNYEDYELKEYLPDTVASPQWITYEIGDFLFEPEIKVIDRNGNLSELSQETELLKEQINYDAVEEEVASRIVEGAKQYAKCMQNDAAKSSVYPYFEKGTNLYSRIQYAETAFVWDHNGYDFEDVEVSEFFRYDENTVSMRVSFTHILKKYGSEDYRNYTDITYFARLIDGEYMIFASYNN